MTDVTDQHVEEPTERRSHAARYAALAVGVVLVLFIVLLATRKPDSSDRMSDAIVGRRVPALTGQTLDGRTVDIDTYRGKWVVVNFLASWCVGCVVEHPDLLAFAKEHAAPGDAEIVGVAFNDNPDALRRFFAERGGTWPVIISDDGRAALDFGVTAVPESFVVDPYGKVVAHAPGVTKEWLDRVIAQAGGAQSPTGTVPGS